jgi:adenylosuccinate synthase
MIQIIQGAQWGSEAKGTIAAELCIRDNISYAVRTGAINAGHTVYYKGKPYAMQQIPVGWVNPNTKLIIGGAAYVSPEVLEREVGMVSDATGRDIRERLIIDQNAGIHLSEFANKSAGSGRHHAFGATGKGSSEAIKHKLDARATGEGDLFRDHKVSIQYDLRDTRRLLFNAYRDGYDIQLEGTQGTWLDFHYGPHPFTTCRQTTAAAWAAEAGLAPGMDYQVVLVARTFPIRVAGNSGPMPQETSWPILARAMNERLRVHGKPEIVPEDDIRQFEVALKDVCANKYNCTDELHTLCPADRWVHRKALSEAHRDAINSLQPDRVERLRALFEITTVTKKLRRIAQMNLGMVNKSARYNNASYIALTFLNYKFPELWNEANVANISDEANDYIDSVERAVNCPVKLVSTGPLPEHILEV